MRITASLLVAIVLCVGARAVMLAQDDESTMTGCIQNDSDDHFSLRTPGGDEVGLTAAGDVSFAEHVGHTVKITARIISVNSDGDPDQVRVTKLQMVAKGCP